MHHLDAASIIRAVHWTFALRNAHLWINRLTKRRRICGCKTTLCILDSSFHTRHQIRLVTNMSLGIGVIEEAWHNNATGADGVKIAVLRKGRAGLTLI
jgi:hypothetical protein